MGLPAARLLVLLKGRALMLLGQREHSELELRRKLRRQWDKLQALQPAEDMPAASGSGGQAMAEDAAAEPDPAATVEAVIAWLKAEHHLSDSRFVESRVHVRSARYGNQRIRQELAQHGLVLPAEVADELKDSEFERAAAVWRRKFLPSRASAEADTAAGEPDRDEKRAAAAAASAESARQSRFLASRGFSPEVIRRVLRQVRDTGTAGPDPD